MNPTVLLLPGLLCDDAVWSHQYKVLSGYSTCIIASYDELASIEAMARHVLTTAPSGPLAVAGHSMGGRVALEILRLAPERVARLALLDSGTDPLPDEPAGSQERTQRMQRLSVAKEQGMRVMGREWARGMVLPMHVDSDVFDDILDMIERKTPRVFEAQIAALLGRPDARPVLAGAACPTLLVCGRQDTWSPLERHEAMHRLLPHSRLVVIEDSGHMTTMEQPEAVTTALVSWLEGGT